MEVVPLLVFATHELAGPPALSTAVYSLATACPRTNSPNMNVVTYAMPASLPKHNLWVVALFRGTLSAEHMMERKHGFLQILAKSHAVLVPLFGKQSGREVNKIEAASDLGFDFSLVRSVDDATEVTLLSDCLAALELRLLDVVETGADHDLCLCSVKRTVTMKPASPPRWDEAVLTTGFLREQGIL